MGAVSRAECVVYENFCIVRKLFAEVFVLFLFFPVETQVFEQYRFAVFKRAALCLCVCAYNVGCENYLTVEKFRKAFCNGCESEFFGFVFFSLFYDGFRSGFACVNLFLILLIELYFA